MGAKVTTRVRRNFASCALAAAVLGATGCGVDAAADGGAELVARRGTLEPQLLLTGELQAVESLQIGVPRTPQFRIQLTWLVEDGAEVRTGDRLVEFDTTAFVTTLDEQRTAALRAERNLEKTRAEGAAAVVQAEMEVAQRQLQVDTAALDAGVPQHILSRREHQDRQLALARARHELAKAEERLRVRRDEAAADEEIARVELERARTEVRTAEDAIRELVITAPRDGVAVVADHPWEERKIQVGDTLWIGLTVLEIPDLDHMRVRARLPDVDDGRLPPGTSVRCVLDAHPDLELGGVVREIAPMATEERGDSLRRFFEVDVELEGSEPGRMRPGMSVRVEAPLPAAHESLLVPRAALDLASRPTRARLDGGGWAEVEIGECSSLECSVLGGLEVGARLAPAEGAS